MSNAASRRSPVSQPHARLAFFWAILGALGTVLALPYVLATNPGVADTAPYGLPVLAAGQALQMGVILFFGGWVALRLGQPLGLDSPVARSWVYRTGRAQLNPIRTRNAAALGLVLGLTTLGLDRLIFLPLLPTAKEPAALAVSPRDALLASFYGGVTEELLTRLIVMTLIAWGLAKVAPGQRDVPPDGVFWTSIVAAGILFAVGHLPAAAGLWDLTPWVVVRVLVLNLYGAIPFGYLYWRWGLEYSMICHFFADVALHVIGGI